MKGLVFTELVEFVEQKFGFDVADGMLEASMLHDKGAYTQGSTYSFDELAAILTKLSTLTGISVNDLIETYARHLFGQIIRLHPYIISGFSSTLPFVAQVDSFIHPEVKKLYPEADLPHFQLLSLTPDELIIDYLSNKPLIPMAIGLIRGTGDYFNESLIITYIENPAPEIRARFTIRFA